MITYNNKQWKVCAVTPAGRKRHLEILKKYVYREMDKGLIDHWQLWANTGVPEDRAYLDEMAKEKENVEVIDLGLTSYSGFNIYKFYKFTVDEDTIYLRFDDDIIYLDKNAVYNLLITRLSQDKPFVVSANVVNNTLFGWIHQAIGTLDTEHGTCNYTRLDEIAHRDASYAENVHKTFIEKYTSGRVEDWEFPHWLLNQFNPFSICCFAYFGSDLQPIDNEDEEMWISSIRPQATNRPCLIVGDAVVVHYGYHTQRGMLDEKPYIYDFYKSICDKES